MPKKPPLDRPELRMLAKLLNLGSIILVLALLGLWLDNKCHTLPIFTAVGIILGVIYSLYEAWTIHHQ